MSKKIEFLWFEDCANHEAARELLIEVLRSRGLPEVFGDIDASDPDLARQLRFPGSPTIRVNGRDIEPSFEEPADFTPRCRVFLTKNGLRGLPEREWITAALDEDQ